MKNFDEIDEISTFLKSDVAGVHFSHKMSMKCMA